VPPWHEEHLVRDDLPVIVLFDGWTSFFRERVVPWRMAMATKTLHQLEQEVLPGYIQLQRWYGAKGAPATHARLTDQLIWTTDQRAWMIALFDVASGAPTAGAATPYFVPLALSWEDGNVDTRAGERAAATIAKTRQQANVGTLRDAFADENFCRALVVAIGESREMPMAHGRLRFVPTAAFAALAGDSLSTLAVSAPLAQSSNTAVVIGERLFLKGYRRVRRGVNPEFEVGRFLTEVAKFPHCVPVAGAIDYVGADGVSTALAMLQGYVSNQGDGWTYTVEYLGQQFSQIMKPAESVPEDVHGLYLTLVRTLGERTAELHRALGVSGGGPAFDPEPITTQDISAWKARVIADAKAALALLARALDRLDGKPRDDATLLLQSRDRLLALIDGVRFDPTGVHKLRYHGDYHLGQVLRRRNDFLIIDFEGEPARSLEERRAKHSPLRDVAGMLRSFDYARWSALRNVALSAEEAARCAPFAEAWLAATRAAFLDAYGSAAAGAGLFVSFEAAGSLLKLFEMEKALYELCYELDNRPTWAEIPLKGLLALAG
jgi:maltose alpha-D-glucosyltransferase/alpha-amylase